MENQKNRIPCLDGLRAVSITLVIVSHLLATLNPHIKLLGNLGVRIFFVISGFLITSILLNEYKRTSKIDLRDFYVRRTLRIFPAYYFYIFVILLASNLGYFQIPTDDFIIASTYTSDYFAPISWQLGHSWSLSVEEQFYLLFPGIFLMLGIKRTKNLLVTIILVVPFVRLTELNFREMRGDYDVPFWYIFAFHRNLDVLASGCLLALCKDSWHKRKIYRDFLNSNISFLVLIVLIVVVIFSLSDITHFYFSVGISILNISIVLCLDWLVINHSSKIGSLLNSSPLVFIGVISYSIYLWQQPFSQYIEDKVWTHFPYNIIPAIIFTLISYYLIEKNFLQLRHKLEKSFLTQDHAVVKNT